MNVREVLPRDAIPSVDDPSFDEAYDGAPDDRVAVYEPADGRPRAYPIPVLDFHEIVNDSADRPIAVTWCPLCGSAVVYDRRVEAPDGAEDALEGTRDGAPVLSFGVSGKLADDDLVMYDRETGSEWKQSLGECIAGPLEGATLDVCPATVTTYERFAAQYDGRVLQPPGGESEAAGEGNAPEPIEYDSRPYRAYEAGEGFGLAAHRGEGSRAWDRDDVGPKTVVLGIERGSEAVGVPLPAVSSAGGAVTLAVDGDRIVVFATDDGIHAFETPFEAFEPAPEGFRADGTTWNGVTGEAADGRRLQRVPARRLFAFAWQDDHGPEAFYTPED